MIGRAGRALARRALGLAVASALAPSPAGVGASGPPGSPPSPRAFPATGALLVRWLGAPVLQCTATAVAPRVLLTAAHCVAACARQRIELTLAPDLAGGARDRWRLARAFVHPGYDPHAAGALHDIALVELDAPLDRAVPEILLSPDEARRMLRRGLRLILVGYGRPRADGGAPGARYAAAATVTRLGAEEMTLGAPGDPQGFEGDSGGPAFLVAPDGTRRLAGIVSRAAGAVPGAAAGTVHTRIDAHADWLATTLRTIERAAPPPAGSAACRGAVCRGAASRAAGIVCLGSSASASPPD